MENGKKWSYIEDDKEKPEYMSTKEGKKVYR